MGTLFEVLGLFIISYYKFIKHEYIIRVITVVPHIMEKFYFKKSNQTNEHLELEFQRITA